MISKIDAAHGHVDAKSPTALKDAGSAALAAGDTVRATHMYTLGIDLALRGAAKPPETAAEWFCIDASSGGVLHALLSNRSLTLLKQGDAAAAVADAEHCTYARPDWAKGWVRLLQALEACGVSLEERTSACARALRACPGSSQLRQIKETLDAQQPAVQDEAADVTAQLAATLRIADDPSDERRAMAAGDVGSILAVGAYGLTKDVARAEEYLLIGAKGKDAASQRNLGLLYLELDRVPEAAEWLRAAADQGDEQALLTLDELGAEAKAKEKAALFKLRALASNDDARARTLLEQLEAERPCGQRDCRVRLVDSSEMVMSVAEV
jgi:TPR repeat protein